jgi:methionyl-tRNA formyltransferase
MKFKEPRVVLYLLGKKGLAVLTGLVNSGCSEHILAVIVATDKAMIKNYSEDIIELSSLNGITVYSRSEPLAAKQDARFAFAVGWRWLIEHQKHEKVIVFHDSLLPRFRGFAPLVSQLLKGEREIGVTALFAVEEYDKGPIIDQEAVKVDYPIKVEQAIELLLPLYQSLAIETLKKIVRHTEISPTPQDETRATYSVWRDDQDLRLNWEESSKSIKRFVDATGFPYAGAYSFLNDKRVIITDVEEVEDINLEFRHAGKAIRFQDNHPVVICGQGLLLIKCAKWRHSQEEITKWPRFRLRFT